MNIKNEHLLDRLVSRGLAFSTIACTDTVSLSSLKEKDYFFWMVGAELTAGSIVAIYTPKCAKSKFHNFPARERGKINHLFSCARRTFRPASKKFSTSQSKNVAFLCNRIKLENGITLNQLKNSSLNYYAQNIWRLGRLPDLPTKAEIYEFWDLVFENNPESFGEITQNLIITPKLQPPVRKNIQSYKYQIAISCASEDIYFVDELYKSCQAAGIIAYYYIAQSLIKNSQTSNLQDMKGIEIYKEIEQVYQKDAYYFVPVFSQNYKKSWTERELALYQEKFVSSYEYMIPIRLDDSIIPGLEGNIKYLYPKDIGISGIVDIIKKKVNRAKSMKI